MKEILVAFSFEEFLLWVGIGFCFAFIFQNWQRVLFVKNRERGVVEVILGALCISAIAFLVGGSAVTLLAVLAFGMGILLKLIASAFSRVFIHLFIFSRPKQKVTR